MKVYSPTKGKIVKIEDVNDPVFSQKMIGDGIGIIPEDENVCSPIEGIIESIFPTNHAFVVKSEEKQILVHIGLDTVSLKGEVFTRIKEIGQKVCVGDLIVKVDYKKIIELGLDPTIIIVEADKKNLIKTDAINVSTSDFIFSD